MVGSMVTERRRGSDRRAAPEWTAWRWFIGGRRKGDRRDDADGVVPNDLYPARLLAAVVAMVGLSALDAGFTLRLLDHGLATEANPLMARLIETDVRAFVALKTALTSFCVVLLVLYSHVRLFGSLRIGHTIYSLTVLYAGLIFYEVTLMARL